MSLPPVEFVACKLCGAGAAISSAEARLAGLTQVAFRAARTGRSDDARSAERESNWRSVWSTFGAMRDRARRITATLRRHPTAVDAAVALLFAVAALVSLRAAFELFGQDPTFERPAQAPLVV